MREIDFFLVLFGAVADELRRKVPPTWLTLTGLAILIALILRGGCDNI